MLTVLSILGVLAVLFAAAVVATREGPILADAPGDVADVALPAGPLQPEDVRQVRFGLAVRGYRMSEVDEVLERLGAELADRDEQIAKLSAKKVAAQPVVAPTPIPDPTPAPQPVPEPATPDPDPEPPTPEPIPMPEPAPLPEREPSPLPPPEPITPADPPRPIVPTEPPLAAPPTALEEPAPAAPPVDVAMVPVEVAPLPERPAGETEDAARD